MGEASPPTSGNDYNYSRERAHSAHQKTPVCVLMSALDLDINNYSINDLEKLFKLTPPYTYEQIKQRELELHKKLQKFATANNIDPNTLSMFMSNAADLLNRAHRPKPRPVNGREYAPTKPLQSIDPISATRPDADWMLPPKHDYITAFPNYYVQGNLNPLRTPTITRSLLIDTRFRENLSTTQSSDITFHLPAKLKKVVSMQLSSFEFPVSFYGISSTYGNNYMYIATTSATTNTTTSTILTISGGNYTTADLVSELNAKSPNTVRFSLDLNTNGSGTNKITIDISDTSVTSALSLDFRRDATGTVDTGTPISTKLGWNLGFTEETYTNKTSYTAETMPDPTATRYIYVVIDDYNNNANDNFISALNHKPIINKNILARIPIKTPYYSTYAESNISLYTTPRQYFGPVDITRLKIQLLDDHGRILAMNNTNYSLTLNFTLLYE